MSKRMRNYRTWLYNLGIFCVIVVFSIPCGVDAVGTIQDEFLAIPRTAETSLAFVPEIGVRMYKAGAFSKNMFRFLAVERWEYRLEKEGYVAGYMRRGEDGALNMCACTKYSWILSDDLKALAESRRKDTKALQDFENLSLDARIEGACHERGTYAGCIPIATGILDPPAFCNVFFRKTGVQVLPIEFSKQSYFFPGVRMLPSERSQEMVGNNIYVGLYNSSGARERARIRGICAKTDKGAHVCAEEYGQLDSGAFDSSLYSLSNEDVRNSKAQDGLSVESDFFAAVNDKHVSTYWVNRQGYDVCIYYASEGRSILDCVPAPDLEWPTVKSGRNNDELEIRFRKCRDKDGNDTKYCSLTMKPGEKDEEVGFLVIKPKINLHDYDLMVTKCKDADGKNCDGYVPSYEEDRNGNVTCLVGLPSSPEKLYVKRDGRYHWINTLPKVLVGISYDAEKKQHVQCHDSISRNLAAMKQQEIDEMVVNRGRFHLPSKDNSGIDKPCLGDMTYSYSNNRAFRHDQSLCGVHSKTGVLPGLCKTRYRSVDNYHPFFLDEHEELDINSVKPLNPIMQGMCVSNFPEHKYKYVTKPLTTLGTASTEINRHVMEASSDNTQCDFIKIEMWGGGASGALNTDHVEVGRSGEYVMALLRTDFKDSKDKKYLVMDVGGGGTAELDKHGFSAKKPGRGTTVMLCDSTNESVCPIKLIANGGGQGYVNLSTGYDRLVHYRVAEGRSSVGSGEVFVPYQDLNNAAGRMSMYDVGCVAPKDAKGTVLVAAVEHAGAGGCAKVEKDSSIVQGGAHGMVKLTCEKWSGSKGQVKEWEGSFCNKSLVSSLHTLQEYVEKEGLEKDFFTNTEIKSPSLCRSLSTLPGFADELQKFVRKVKGSPMFVSTQREADELVAKTLQPLEKTWSKEARVLDAYINARSAISSEGVETDHEKIRKLFLDNMKKIIQSKVIPVKLDEIRIKGKASWCNEGLKTSLRTLREYAQKENLEEGFFTDADIEDPHLCWGLSELPGLKDALQRFVNVVKGDSLKLTNTSQEADALISETLQPLEKAWNGDTEFLDAYIIKGIMGKALAGKSSKPDYYEKPSDESREKLKGQFLDSMKKIMQSKVTLKREKRWRYGPCSNGLLKITTNTFMEYVKEHAERQGLDKSFFKVINSEHFCHLVDEEHWFVNTMESFADLMKGNVYIEGNPKWLERILERLETVLSTEESGARILNAYISARDDTSSGDTETDHKKIQELFLDNMKKIIQSKAVTSRVEEMGGASWCDEGLETSLHTLQEYVRKEGLEEGFFTNEDIEDPYLCWGLSKLPGLAGALQRLVSIVNSSDPASTSQRTNGLISEVQQLLEKAWNGDKKFLGPYIVKGIMSRVLAGKGSKPYYYEKSEKEIEEKIKEQFLDSMKKIMQSKVAVGKTNKIVVTTRTGLCDESITDALRVLRAYVEKARLKGVFFADTEVNSEEFFCWGVSTLPGLADALQQLVGIVQGEQKRVSTQQEASGWVKETLEPLERAWNEGETFLGPYIILVQSKGTKPHYNGSTKEVTEKIRKQFLDSMEEIIQSKVTVEEDICNMDFLRDLGAIYTYADRRDLDFTDIDVQSLCFRAGPAYEFASEMRKIASIVRGPQKSVSTRQEADQWIEKTLRPLKEILEWDTGVVNAYHFAVRVISPEAYYEELKKRFLDSIREIMQSKVTVGRESQHSGAIIGKKRYGESTIKKNKKLGAYFCSEELDHALRAFREYAERLSLETSFVKTLDSIHFCYYVSRWGRFVDAMRALATMVHGPQKHVSTRQEANAWIEEALKRLEEALDSETRVLEIYIGARKVARSGDTETDRKKVKKQFLDSTKKIIQSKVTVDG